MIRTLQKADINNVADIWLDTNLKAHYFISAQYWKTNFELVKEMLPQAEVYVYEKDKKIQGFIGLNGEYIEGIFVSSEMQSQGIGKLLLNHAKNRKTKLLLHVYQRNTRAIHFYQREGFEIQCEGLEEATGEMDYVMVWQQKSGVCEVSHMENFKEKEYKVFEMFDKQWAVVTAGSMEHYNSCTVSWGSLGNIWGHAGKSRPTVTVYVHPARYTSEFLQNSDTFTVSFYPESCKKALGYIGSHSGRDGDKAVGAGLTPVEIGQGVTYKEANLTFLCKKLYQHQFSKEDIATEVQEYYASMPKVYPDFNGGWQPHIVFVGEIIEVRDER